MTDLRPRKPFKLGTGALLAIGVHLLLLVALTVQLNWRSETPSAVSAELWSAVPQVAAPPAVEAPPPPPAPPPPAPAPAPAPPPPAPTVDRDAEIALEKKKREADRQRERERERELAEKREADKREAEKKAAAEKKRDAERLAKEKADKAEKAEQQAREAQRRKDDERLAALAEQARQDQLKRLQSQLGGVAGATGSPSATGTALRDSGPSASYAGRVAARIKPNIVFGDEVSGNPEALVEVRAAPDGTIVGRRISKSSGVKEWDEAVLRAIDRTATLPRDTDGRVPSPMVIGFRPRE
jgi:colicin import membrane protein